MTKNSFVSLSVMSCGVLLSVVGSFVDPTRTVSCIGLTFASSGMIQSYYGNVFELAGWTRFWFFLLGVPLTISAMIMAFRTLRDYFAAYQWMLVIVVATLIFQLSISVISLRVWGFSARSFNI